MGIHSQKKLFDWSEYKFILCSFFRHEKTTKNNRTIKIGDTL